MPTRHVRPGQKPLQARQEAAGRRDMDRAARSTIEQVEALRSRPGASKKEIDRLG